MFIALDYDNTITRDHELWSEFVRIAKRRSHVVTIVTFRNINGDNDDVKRFSQELGIQVIYTDAEQKAKHFTADVWIDDMPETIPDPETMWK